MNQPIALGETPRSRTAAGAITGAQYIATATSVWIANVTASGVIHAEPRTRLSAPPVSSFTLDRFQQALGALRDRVIDHLAVDLDCGRAACFGRAKRGDDALGGGDFVRGRRVAFISGTDLIGMDAKAPLETCAPAARDRSSKSVGILQAKPRTVERAFQSASPRSEHDSRSRVFQL